MAKKKKRQVTEEADELSDEEVENVNGEPLPDREQMSMVWPGPPGVQLDPNDIPTP
jgi:hypothetical protein